MPVTRQYNGRDVTLPTSQVASAFEALVRRGRPPTPSPGKSGGAELEPCKSSAVVSAAAAAAAASAAPLTVCAPKSGGDLSARSDLLPRASKRRAKKPPPPRQPAPPGCSSLSPRDFEFGRTVGQGRFGTVWLGRERKSGYIAAIKAVRKSVLMDMGMDLQLRREVEAQSQLRHANIIRMLGMFVDTTSIYLVLEFAPNGTLRRRMSQGAIPEATCALYLVQVAGALEYCHSKHIIHRDVKPENILLGHRGEIKLADFGSSVHSLSGRRRTAVGTFGYMSPEILQGHDHGPQSDVWSLGVLFYEMLLHELPFRTWEQALRPPEVFPAHASLDAQNLIKLFLKSDPPKRLLLWELPWHPWVQRLIPPSSSSSPSAPGCIRADIPSTRRLVDITPTGSLF
jgi:aurora kinase